MEVQTYSSDVNLNPNIADYPPSHGDQHTEKLKKIEIGIAFLQSSNGGEEVPIFIEEKGGLHIQASIPQHALKNMVETAVSLILE